MDESGEQRVEKAKSSQQDAQSVDAKRSDEVLQNDATASPSDAQSLDEFEEIISQEDDLGALAGDIGA